MTNDFAAQPLRFRLEALMSAPPPESTNAVTLLDLASPAAAAWPRSTADGVELRVESTAFEVPGGTATVLTATNRGTVEQRAAWARIQYRPAAPIDLAKHQALGFWIEGDGQGELLAIRLESPTHLAFGAVADRYLPIDFTGPRWVTLVETESERWSDYVWQDGKSPYNVYREDIHFDAVDTISLWLQNLPPGRTVRCRIGPVLARPMIPATGGKPILRVNGQAVELDGGLTSGQWIETDGSGGEATYGPQGEPVRQRPGATASPILRTGLNELRLECPPGPEPGPAGRYRLTVFARGEVLTAAGGLPAAR